MQALVVYSGHDARKLAEAVAGVLPEGSALKPAAEAPDPRGYDLVMIGFHADDGRADAAAAAFFEKLNDCRTAFFFVMSDRPNSALARGVADETKRLLESRGNVVVGHFSCRESDSEAAGGSSSVFQFDDDRLLVRAFAYDVLNQVSSRSSLAGGRALR
ncbi:MAG: flavodoxin family protein [Deltaproteobacteria bacterium]|jgi:hypothetical protein|nr:flavodoxin family protein [Deltaproteobacteria bacterium]